MVKSKPPTAAKLKKAVIIPPGPVESILKKSVAVKKVKLPHPTPSLPDPLTVSVVSSPPLLITDVIKKCASAPIRRSAASDSSNYFCDENVYAELWGRVAVWLRKVRPALQ